MARGMGAYLLAGVLLLACRSPDKEATPRDALVTYYQALLDNDALRAARVTNHPDEKLGFMINTKVLKSMLRFAEVARARYAADAACLPSLPNAQELIDTARNTPIGVDGDVATAKVKGETLTLRRVRGAWILEVQDFPTPEKQKGELILADNFEVYVDHLILGVKAGKYSTAESACAALLKYYGAATGARTGG